MHTVMASGHRWSSALFQCVAALVVGGTADSVGEVSTHMHGSCHHLADTGGGAHQKRCDAYPAGLTNTVEECCALCAPGNDINCSAWIHRGDKPGKVGMCWPMEYVVGTRPNPGTVIGGKIDAAPPPPVPCSAPLKPCPSQPGAYFCPGGDTTCKYYPPQPPLPTSGECHYQPDTVYETPATGDSWEQRIETTSAGACCAICRSIPECTVANYEPIPEKLPNWVQSSCTMRGNVDLSRPTHVRNATACVVRTRPPPALPAPSGAMNVLYFVSDDARPELPSYGQNHVQAPNLAKLAARGLTFMHAYCQQSICSPSRNSFLSSKRPQNTRVWNFINDFRQQFPFHPSFPQWFKQHGYTSLGHSKLYHPSHPLNFDEPLSWSQDATNGTDTGIRVGAIAGYPVYHRDSGKSRGCGYFDVCPTVDPSRDQFVDHHTATEVIATLDMVVKAKQRRPFFLGVGMIRPHLPFVVPADVWKQYSEDEIKLPGSSLPPLNVANISLNDQIFQGDHTFCPNGDNYTVDCPSMERSTLTPAVGITPFKPFDANNTRFLRHGYYAAITFMDEQVGRVVDHVEALGLTNNTIVIFHGDHGWHLGEQGLWTKKTLFELGNRVPLIIAAPHLTASHGKQTSAIAELVDVYPTVVALAGLPAPPDVDGVSLLPAFTDPSAAPGDNDYAFSEFPQCPSDPEVSLWHTGAGCQNVPREKIGFFGFSIRSSSYRYTEWHPWSQELKADWSTMTGRELYDYRRVDMTDFDQFDRVNVAGKTEHADAEKKLAAALRAHYNRM